MSTFDSSKDFIPEKTNFITELNKLIKECDKKSDKLSVFTDKDEQYIFKETNEQLNVTYDNMEEFMKGNIYYTHANICYVYLTKNIDNQNRKNLGLQSGLDRYNFYGNIEKFPGIWPDYNITSSTSIFDLSKLTKLTKIKSFYDVNWLKEIVFPKTTKLTLGNSCFQGCGLTKVTIPDNVVDIGLLCFAGCKYLTTVTLPKSVTKLPLQCFTGCISLKNIDLQSVVILDELCFSRSGLTSISSSNITTLGSNCFRNCISLKDVTLPSVTELSNDCFYGCENLEKVTTNNYALFEKGLSFFKADEISRILGPKASGGNLKKKDGKDGKAGKNGGKTSKKKSQPYLKKSRKKTSKKKSQKK